MPSKLNGVDRDPLRLALQARELAKRYRELPIIAGRESTRAEAARAMQCDKDAGTLLAAMAELGFLNEYPTEVAWLQWATAGADAPEPVPPNLVRDPVNVFFRLRDGILSHPTYLAEIALAEDGTDFIPLHQESEYRKSASFCEWMAAHFERNSPGIARESVGGIAHTAASMVMPAPDGGVGAIAIYADGSTQPAKHAVKEANAGPAHVVPTSNDLLILKALGKSPSTLKRVDIQSATRLSSGTVQKCLQNLEKRGLVHRPHGQRRGWALTDAGERLLASATN